MYVWSDQHIQVTLNITDPVVSYRNPKGPNTEQPLQLTGIYIGVSLRIWCPKMVLACMPKPQLSAVPSSDRLSQDILQSDKLMAKGSITSAVPRQNSLSCQQAFSVCYSAYPFIHWSCFMEANAPGDAAQAAAQSKRGKLKRHLCTVDESQWFYKLSQLEPDLALSAYVSNSVAVLAEIPLRSPQKIFIFIIKKISFWFKVSKK